MPDNWEFVIAAYGLAALLLGGYWRRLVRLERALPADRAPGHSVSVEGAASPPPSRRVRTP